MTLKYSIVSAFKYAQYFDTVKIDELKPSSNDRDNLHMLPLLDYKEVITGLKHELPAHMAIASI